MFWVEEEQSIRARYAQAVAQGGARGCLNILTIRDKPVTRSILFSWGLALSQRRLRRGYPMTNTPMSLFDAIHSQRAIRHFSPQPVSDETIETLLRAAICAPSG